jgi:DNA-binding NarL/FixJ family response regulator/tetratricopeptide (TPR) repeat protein
VPIESRATPLVGRVEELRQLCELVGAGDTAQGAVLLGGDAGAGKSRLVGELAAHVAANGWRVLVGHCLDFGAGSPPYLPFSEALGRFATDSPAAAESLLEASPAIARLLPAHRMLADAAREMEPTDRSVLYDAVHGAIVQLSTDAPLLVIVEDVHWADQSTRDLLRFLFARGFTSPVALLATYRSDDLHRRHPLRAALAEWMRLPSVSRLQLDPLTDGESRELIHALSDDTLSEPELQRILARAEGNPFFLEELVDASASSGGELPADLADLLLVRLDQIGDDARLAVRAAAVAGRRVSHRLLASGTALDDAALDAAVRAAVEANILVAVGTDGYAFRHALLAEAIYLDLLPGERVRLHATFAAALASHHVEGSAAELARHARASHDLVTAARASIEAGEEAMAVGGPEEALRQFELAMELLSDPHVARALAEDDNPSMPQADRISVTVRATSAAAAAGHQFRAVALAQHELDSLPPDAPTWDRVRLIQVLVATAQVLDTNLDLLQLTSEAVRLLADQPPSRMRALVLNLHARASQDRARDDEAIRWATEALTIAEDLDFPGIATDARLMLARLDERSGDPLRAEAAMTTAIKGAAAAGESMAELRALYSLASLHYGQGRLTKAIELYRKVTERARDLGRPWAQYGLEAACIGAIAAHVSGDWPAAEDFIDTTGQRPPEQARAMLAATALEIAAGRGDIDALTTKLPLCREWWQRDGLLAITSGGAAIELYGQRGDLEMAIRTYDDVVASVGAMWQGGRFGARIRLAALLLGHLATSAASATVSEREALVVRGDEVADGAIDAASANRHSGPEGIAWTERVRAENLRLHWLAGIEPPKETELVDAWRRAVTAFEAFGHVYETARSRARLAAVLTAVGDPEAAAIEAGLARSVAVRLGAKPLLDELRALPGAEPASGRTPGGAARDTEALTPREHDVLTLVATGRSNREIAQQLYISAKTVSVHISNVLAKLDASSRTEAVAIARRRGLLV